MNELIANVPKHVGDLHVDMEAVERFTFTEVCLKQFSELVQDRAPIHFDDSFALQQGYSGRIVFGLLVAAPFSGLLGMKLPGPYTVIHNFHFEMARPVYVSETIDYLVRVRQCSPATRTVVLDLAASRGTGEVVLRGTAQCGFNIGR